jgi:hypothetical protein
MIPKIRFRYSDIYDVRYRNNPRIQETLKKQGKTYPSEKRILNYISQIKKEWEKIEKKILTELEKVSGLRWKEKKIICYCIGQGIPFSDPLTMPVSRPKTYFIDTLIHELIHQLMTQENNLNKSKNAWSYFFKKYKKEEYNTIIHIPLHAIHSHIFHKFFSQKRLNHDYKYIKRLPAYKRSWDTVKKEGYQNIIKEFRSRIK